MGNRIAELRKARRISQAELAEAVAVIRLGMIYLGGGRSTASPLVYRKVAY